MPGTPNEHRRSSSFAKLEPFQASEQQGSRATTSPAVATKQEASTVVGTPTIKREASTSSVKQVAIEETDYEPSKRAIESHGGYDILPLSKLGESLNRLIPDVPLVDEMGVIDLRALTLSLQSGIHAEVRFALDHLTVVSMDPRITLDLEKCDDLTDVLVDCGEDQLEFLSEEAVEVSDALDLPAYEDVVRACRAEAETLQDVSAIGTTAYDMDRAADRLVAVTQLLRNLSFNESNHRLLSTPSVIGFVSNAIRLLGTRNLLLRNYKNVADFYKDMITFLSNITGGLELPSRDDALHILQFILVFAPQPPPCLSGNVPLRFGSYVPLAHRQLPLAVDCLAKLLARQEPNRTLYSGIFTSSHSANSSEAISCSELLTSAFGLSISVLPERSKRLLSSQTEMRTVEARKAVLTQGMLAADILASMIAATGQVSEAGEVNLARAWLESEDRWAGGLLHMAYVLLVDPRQHAQSQAQRTQNGHMPVMEPDHQSYGLITHRGLQMLVRLVEKAGMRSSQKGKGMRQGGRTDDGAVKHDMVDDYDDDDCLVDMVQGDPRPMRETVIGALGMPEVDKTALRLLCGLYEMVG